jgi:NADH-quinone oxidoreductase subunit L
MTHAFFKACLFLGSGSVIHGMHAVEHDEVAAQDMRNMGGLKRVMPRTARTYFIACLAITAAPIPLFAGFWSKDEILWRAFTTENLWQFQNGFPLGKLVYTLGLVAAMCTSFYMWRSYYLTFEGEPRKAVVLKKVHESPIAMTHVLWALAGLSTIGGVLFGLSKNFFHLGLGPAEPLLEKWLHPVFDLATINGADHAPRFAEPGSTIEIGLMCLSVGLALVSWYVAKTKYGPARPADWDAIEAKIPGYTLAQNKYYIDEIYQATVIRLVLVLRIVLAQFDRYVIDGFVNFSGVVLRTIAWISGRFDDLFVDGAVRAASEGLLELGGKVRQMQSGKIQNYVLAALGGVAIFALIAQLVR